MLTATLLPLLLLQAGPNPLAGAMPDYSAEVQDRPPRQVEQPVEAIDAATAFANAWLKDCLELVIDDPARAHVQAQLRRDATEGEEQVLAQYCLGMAASELELWSDAQSAFLAARDGTGSAERRTRARFGAMAANAAIAAGDNAAALALLDAAYDDAIASEATQIAALAQIDRARLLVAADREESAAAALLDARTLAPEASEAWLLSATLMRRLERLTEAQEMIERAAVLAPSGPAIALEAGLIAVLSGREEAAQASWNSVIALAPDSPEAQVARGYLAQLGIATVAP